MYNWRERKGVWQADKYVRGENISVPRLRRHAVKPSSPSGYFVWEVFKRTK
jgi:hypothetical protein